MLKILLDVTALLIAPLEMVQDSAGEKGLALTRVASTGYAGLVRTSEPYGIDPHRQGVIIKGKVGIEAI